tara:strand:+ start:85 stop:465 length:381 start_codon:yes stop_codon:yes gene_type:complete
MKNLYVFKGIKDLMKIIDKENKNQITTLQIKVLMYIMTTKKCNSGEICKNLKISRPTCSRILNKLSNESNDYRGAPTLKLIYLDYDYETLSALGYYDRRTKYIALTKKGELMADEISNIDFTGNKK